jgi:hypothetical protein
MGNSRILTTTLGTTSAHEKKMGLSLSDSPVVKEFQGRGSMYADVV